MNLPRRTALGGLGAAALSGVAGCSQPSSSTSDPSKAGSAAPESLPQSDVPVGSAVISASGAYVVSQPTSGDFKAFRSVCPHAGCLVNKISGEKVVCPCHQSTFSVVDGSVLAGPAKTGLTPATVTTSGATVRVGD